MKLIFLLFFALSWGISLNSLSQTTITLQPGPTDGKDAQLRIQYPDTSSGTQPDFKAIIWTCGGMPCGSRGLIEFDLSAIPQDATINNASLSLYYNPTSGDPGHSTLSGSNACWLRRVTSYWSEDSVTWDTQPSTSQNNQVNLPASTYDTVDYPNINVTQLIQDMLINPDSSFGFMLLLQTESPYRSLIFASSDHLDSNLWPKLEISYLVVGTEENNINSDYNLFPNPFGETTTLVFKNENHQTHTLTIFDNLGRAVRCINNIQSDSIEIQKGTLESGIYVFKLSNSKGFAITGRLIVY